MLTKPSKRPYHDAGLFVRRFKKVGRVQVKSFEWIVDDFSQTKNIQVIGTQKTIGPKLRVVLLRI
jgi:hypothetical protein